MLIVSLHFKLPPPGLALECDILIYLFTGNISIEAFTCMMVFKNIFSFGLTWSGYHWLIVGGIKNVFTACASVQVAVCLLTIPLYILGKRNRSFFARNDILKTLGLW